MVDTSGSTNTIARLPEKARISSAQPSGVNQWSEK